MRLVCPQNQLAANLALVGRAVASRPTHPILANIRLDAISSSQSLGMTAFDLNLGIQVSFPAQVVEAGSITLPAKLLNDIVSRLPDEDVTISIDKDNTMVSILCGSGRYQLHGLPVEEFPELPQIGEDGETTYLPVESMLSGLASTLFATSADDTKRILTGVHLTASADRLEFAATDGHRLAVVQTGFLDADGHEVVHGRHGRPHHHHRTARLRQPAPLGGVGGQQPVWKALEVHGWRGVPRGPLAQGASVTRAQRAPHRQPLVRGGCRWFRGRTPPVLTSPREKLVCMSLTLGSLNSVSIAQRE